jgi:hypothetical protein
MGTLTKKLHILKSGGTEETCNIYTTPEEVGGSPYLALEVDGQKGYIKLGSITDANATHLRVKKDGTTYAAWKKATVDVPTGTVSIDGNGVFTVPTGVTVIQVSHPDLGVVYVGVTPGTKHTLSIDWEMVRPQHYGTYIMCDSHYVEYLKDLLTTEYDEQEPSPVFDVDWSPEINKKTPNITDY